jgi:ABC-2 type transport system permease protein
MRRIFAQARKELTQIIRDPLALALALVLPVFLLVLLSTAISLTVTGMPIVVQDLDGSPASRLHRRVPASNTFPCRRVARHDAALRGLPHKHGARRADHSFSFRRGPCGESTAEVQMLVDATDANTAKLVQGYSGEIVAAWNARNGASLIRSP